MHRIVLSGILCLNFHQDSAKFWSTELLDILQAFLLIKIFPLNCSECNTLTHKMKIFVPNSAILTVFMLHMFVHWHLEVLCDKTKELCPFSLLASSVWHQYFHWKQDVDLGYDLEKCTGWHLFITKTAITTTTAFVSA